MTMSYPQVVSRKQGLGYVPGCIRNPICHEITLLILVSLLLFVPVSVAAQAPETLSFQGRLTNPGGGVDETFGAVPNAVVRGAYRVPIVSGTSGTIHARGLRTSNAEQFGI
jgi:hypothetical protein